MLGKETNEEQTENNSSIVIIFFVSHFDILGNDCNEVHSVNRKDKFVTVVILNFEMSQIFVNDEHL